MNYLILSFSYKTVPTQLASKLAFNSDNEKKKWLTILLAHDVIKEAILLCTCNRTEIITYASDLTMAKKIILNTLGYNCNVSVDKLRELCTIHKQKHAIKYLFSLSSSLESLVVGETQITGQLKDAYRFSMQYEFCSTYLSKAIHHAVKCSANIRNSTNISKDNVSIASVALKQLQEHNINLENKKILIIGVGEMSLLAIKYFLKHSCKITLINRTIQKAQSISHDFEDKIKVKRLENLHQCVDECDIIFSATSSKNAIITNDMAKNINDKKYWFDMAVPKDIEQIENKNITIFDIDALKKIIANTKNNRAQEAKIAVTIVDDFTKKFFENEQEISIDTIKNIKKYVQNICDNEIKYAIKKKYIKEEEKEIIEKILSRVFNKHLHNTISILKQKSSSYTSSNLEEVMKFMLCDGQSIEFVKNND